MKRFAEKYLSEWKSRKRHKPLVIRGARQVGKSWLVKEFAKSQFDNCLEINFERTPDAAGLFESKSPQKIRTLLEARFGIAINPGRTLLFLDEIQSAPEVFAALRYFYEDMPELHIVAAGSLLEFALAEHSFSMPVGRIEYMHLGPLSFGEFLGGTDKASLWQWAQDWSIGDLVPESIHREMMEQVKFFTLVGGMPEAAEAFASTGSAIEVERIQQSILSTYRDDFGKYASQSLRSRIEKIYASAPFLIGKKFKYSQVDREERAHNLALALEALCKARVLTRIRHAHSNGLPLAAEADEKTFKLLFLDVGLLCRACGVKITDIERVRDLTLVNSGAVCEQWIGQHLLYSGTPYDEPEIYYWTREKPTSSAEVDYVVAASGNNKIIPIEVKAGGAGRLKSLQIFLEEKQRDFGIRFCNQPPMLSENLPSGRKLLSLPFYLYEKVRLRV